MRQPPHHAERYRMRSGPFASNITFGNNGLFIVPGPNGRDLRVIASDADEGKAVFGDRGSWEHVSVSLPNRCPNWQEMCLIKDLFWDEEESVLQFHPPKSEYVNDHPYVLHLWKPVGVQVPLPHRTMVGIQDRSNMTAEEASGLKGWQELARR